MTNEALKLAEEAKRCGRRKWYDLMDGLIDRLAALAQAKQDQGEPAWWMFKSITGGNVFYEGPERPKGAEIRATPLYTQPAPVAVAPQVPADVQRELIAAAQAVIERWDTPAWRDAPHTAIFINRMRAAIDYAMLAASPQPTKGE